MLELLLIAIGLVGSLAAGLYDLKTTNIPDKLCISMIIIGLAIHIYTGVFVGDYSYLENSFLFGGLFLGFAVMMYYTGQWGGGDGELLVAMGVLLPSLHSVSTLFPFSISFFINSFFVGAFWSIAFSMYYVYKNPILTRKFFSDFKRPVVFAMTFAPVVLSAISLLFSEMISILFLLVFALFVFYRFSKVIEQAFYKRIPVRQLRLDDMLGEDIPRLRLYKRHIKGLTKDQVSRIKKTKKYVVIREGVRYGMVFPLALLFTLFFGDFFLLFFHSL
jgi:Flp pilus assembly protein protease CpaA